MELLIGRVIKSHGIKGEVAIDPTTDDIDARFHPGAVLHGTQAGREHTLTIASVRPHHDRLLVLFEEIPDRTAADSLRGTQFFAEPLADDDEDSFYDHELEGLTVFREGAVIGEVTGVTRVPGRRLLEIKLHATGHEALVPFVTEIVPEVDLNAGCIVITPPEGLLEL